MLSIFFFFSGHGMCPRCVCRGCLGVKMFRLICGGKHYIVIRVSLNVLFYFLIFSLSLTIDKQHPQTPNVGICGSVLLRKVHFLFGMTQWHDFLKRTRYKYFFYRI